MKPSEVKPGDRFGLLTVQSIQQHYNSKGKKQGKEALCLCDCGNQKTVVVYSLVNGDTTSCGCLLKQSHINNGRRNIKHAHAYLDFHPEIRQENGRQAGSENIKHAHAFFASHPEIRQEAGRQAGKKTGSENIKHAHAYLDSHSEILQENGRNAIRHAHAYLDFHPEIRQENGRNAIRHAHEFLRRDPDSESSFQKEYRLFLEKNNILYETEFFLDNHYFDFKVSNFLIEINGDIYHSSRYENLQNPLANGPSTQYLSSIYHKSLLDLATKYGYRLIQLWEHNTFDFNSSLLFSQLSNTSDINNYIDYIDTYKVICNDYGFQISGEYLPDPGRWISTTSHEVVPSSYEKGKVLVFNSGYTIL